MYVLIDLVVKLFKSTKPTDAILPALCKQLFRHVKGICHVLGQYLVVQQSHRPCYRITMTISANPQSTSFWHFLLRYLNMLSSVLWPWVNGRAWDDCGPLCSMLPRRFWPWPWILVKIYCCRLLQKRVAKKPKSNNKSCYE